MIQETGVAEVKSDYVYDPSISKLENDWLQVIPSKFRRPAWLCLQEMRQTVAFNNNIEKSKASLAYMDAFVTAIHMAQEEKGPQDEQNSTKKQDKKENNDYDSTPPQASRA